MKSYIIVEEPCIEHLCASVEVLVEKGYQPHGGMVPRITNNGHYYYQTMFKAPLKEKPVARKTKNDYSPEFEHLWSLYPKREGSNPKNKAYSAYKARLSEGIPHADLYDGLQRYKHYIDCQNTEHTGLVMQGSRFFGPGEEYKNTWNVSTQARAAKKLPRNDEDLAEFAVANNLHAPGCAPQYIQNAAQYRTWIQERLPAACV